MERLSKGEKSQSKLETVSTQDPQNEQQHVSYSKAASDQLGTNSSRDENIVGPKSEVRFRYITREQCMRGI